MEKNARLFRFLKFYMVTFAAAAIATLAFFSVGILALIVDSFYGKPENLPRFWLGYCIFLLVAARFWVWFKLTVALNSGVENLGGKTSNQEPWMRVSKLLCTSFVIDVAERIFMAISPRQSLISHKDMAWPDSGMDWPRYCLAVFTSLVKVVTAISDFVLPMTYGLASLALAAVIFIFAKSNDLNGKTTGFQRENERQ